MAAEYRQGNENYFGVQREDWGEVIEEFRIVVLITYLYVKPCLMLVHFDCTYLYLSIHGPK